MNNRYIVCGLAVSIIYVTALFVIALNDPTGPVNKPMRLNEWGDYFAGSLQLLALGWFVATLILQAKELSAQREELELTRKEMKEAREVWSAQQEEQKRLAIATEEANKLAAKGQFFIQLPLLINTIETALGGVIEDLASIQEKELSEKQKIWYNEFQYLYTVFRKAQNGTKAVLKIQERINKNPRGKFYPADLI